MSKFKLVYVSILGAIIIGCSTTNQDSVVAQPSITTPDSSNILDASKYSKANAMDHVVVVVMENRSLDNLLGRLYTPEEKPNFDGVIGKNLSNPIPKWAQYGAEKKVVPYHIATDMDSPNPDTGEWYAHTNTQLYNIMNQQNKFAYDDKIVAPWNAPKSSSQKPTMNGFVTDYISAFTAEMGRQPTYDEYAQVMSGYTPEQVPVISTIARGFGVFDHWYSEVPSQTFTNRSFWVSAQSSGFVKNSPSSNFIMKNNGETIFNRLDAHGKTWKIYVSEPGYFSLQALINAPKLRDKFKTNVVPFSQFEKDVANGTLPDFSFIEPNMTVGHNDYHPAAGRMLIQGRSIPVDPPSSILGGELLMAKIYNAVKNSSSATGSNYLNTTLLIGFDEPGGTYDHVAPPMVVAPESGAPKGQFGFDFQRSGYRVPAILVSAWVPNELVVNEEYRHTSLIATLRKKWNLGAPFTNRDATARTFDNLFTLDKPRLSNTWPSVTPRPVPGYDFEKNAFGLSVSGLGKAIIDGTIEFAHKDGYKLPCESQIDKNGNMSEITGYNCIGQASAIIFPQLAESQTIVDMAKYNQK